MLYGSLTGSSFLGRQSSNFLIKHSDTEASSASTFKQGKHLNCWTPYRVILNHWAMIWRCTYLEIAQLQGSWGIPDNLWRFTQSSWGLLFTFCCYHLQQHSTNITPQPALHSQTVLTRSTVKNQLRGGN